MAYSEKQQAFYISVGCGPPVGVHGGEHAYFICQTNMQTYCFSCVLVEQSVGGHIFGCASIYV